MHYYMHAIIFNNNIQIVYKHVETLNIYFLSCKYLRNNILRKCNMSSCYCIYFFAFFYINYIIKYIPMVAKLFSMEIMYLNINDVLYILIFLYLTFIVSNTFKTYLTTCVFILTQAGENLKIKLDLHKLCACENALYGFRSQYFGKGHPSSMCMKHTSIVFKYISGTSASRKICICYIVSPSKLTNFLVILITTYIDFRLKFFFKVF